MQVLGRPGPTWEQPSLRPSPRVPVEAPCGKGSLAEGQTQLQPTHVGAVGPWTGADRTAHTSPCQLGTGNSFPECRQSRLSVFSARGLDACVHWPWTQPEGWEGAASPGRQQRGDAWGRARPHRLETAHRKEAAPLEDSKDWGGHMEGQQGHRVGRVRSPPRAKDGTGAS